MSQEIRKYLEDGMNINTYKLIFKDSYTKEDYPEFLKNAFEISNIVSMSSDENSGYFDFGVEGFIKKTIDGEQTFYTYKNSELQFNFILLTDFLEFGDFAKKELLSEKRYGLCHIRSVSLAISLERKNIPCKVVTGYTKKYGMNILHTVVEFEYNGEEKIIDYTQNIIMNKDDYIKINNFKEVFFINGINILNDTNYFNNFVSLKFYTVFRDDIMKNIEKNSFLFEINEFNNFEKVR